MYFMVNQHFFAVRRSRVLRWCGIMNIRRFAWWRHSSRRTT